jgi:type IV fimbrial biogenesis protein FimT
MKRHTPCVRLPGAMGVSGQNRTDCRFGWNHSKAGFTLIEVMVTSAIIAIGAVLAVPAYLQWIAGYELRQATTELASTLTLARMTAKNRNAPVAVQLSVITCPPATSDCGHVSVVSGALAAPTVLPGRITGFTGGPVQFTPLGLLVGGVNQVISVQAQTSNGTVSYSTVVMPSGKVSWCAKATCP